MIKQLSKIIAKSLFGLVLILLAVESSFIIPAYFNLIFDTQAIASKGARNNHITSQDVTNLISNITKGGTNKRYENILVETKVAYVDTYGNRKYNEGDTYPIQASLAAIDTLQRGDSFVLKVETQYRFLMPEMFGKSWSDQRTGLPITLSYEVPITCLKFNKEIK